MILKKVKSILNYKLSIWQKSWLITLLCHSIGLYLICKNLVKEPVVLPNLKNYKYVSLVKVPNSKVGSKSVNLIKNTEVKVGNKTHIPANKSVNMYKEKKNIAASNNSVNVSSKVVVDSKAEHGKVINKKKEENIVYSDEISSKQNLNYKQSSGDKEIINNVDADNNSKDTVDGVLNDQLYEAQIVKVIMQHWIKPLQLSKQDFCIWKVNLSLRGEVVKLELISSSNNENLEISSQEAIYAAQPFLLPNSEGEATSFLELRITFKDN